MDPSQSEIFFFFFDVGLAAVCPLPARERMIPKSGGKLRRLGIASCRIRRVAQAALKLVLEPIFEAEFHPCSYGFRPKRRAQDAIPDGKRVVFAARDGNRPRPTLCPGDQRRKGRRVDPGRHGGDEAAVPQRRRPMANGSPRSTPMGACSSFPRVAASLSRFLVSNPGHGLCDGVPMGGLSMSACARRSSAWTRSADGASSGSSSRRRTRPV